VITEAVDTAVTLAWTLLLWVAVISAIGTLLLLGGIAAVAWTLRAAWRALSRRLSHEVPENGPRLPRAPERRSEPRWALPPEETPGDRKSQKAA
jgi:hypothetical protein